MIHTTVNLDAELYEFLFTDYRDSMELSNTELVCMIMHCVNEKMTKRERPTRAVEYQKNISQKDWVVVHLYLTEEEYDHFVDMRTFFKMSVARMVSFGLRQYNREILKLFDTGPDKNLFPEYSFGRVAVSGRQFFIIGWRRETKIPEMNSFP